MWSEAEIKALNELQSGVRVGHPYTCPRRGDGKHHDNGHDLGCLVATADGWVCPDCDYTQGWAHAGSLDLPRAEEMVGLLEHLTGGPPVLGLPFEGSPGDAGASGGGGGASSP